MSEGAAGAEDNLEVERSGGFGGLTVRASVPVAELESPERAAIEQRLGRAPSAPSGPDRFVYRFRMHGREAVVQEDLLPAELQPLLDRLSDSWS
ncbi:MAG TPA: protealysin inhibitor emfourin [Terriglobales bacterium]|nr:protealysin inhibitor emfourin [Terriglobales bacterium]